jgi:hypothetical protein
MDDSGAGVGRHEVGGDDPPGRRLRAAVATRGRRGRACGAKRVEGGKVRPADEVSASQSFDHFEGPLRFFDERGGERFGDDIFAERSGVMVAERLGIRRGIPQDDVIKLGTDGGELV